MHCLHEKVSSAMISRAGYRTAQCLSIDDDLDGFRDGTDPLARMKLNGSETLWSTVNDSLVKDACTLDSFNVHEVPEFPANDVCCNEGYRS